MDTGDRVAEAEGLAHLKGPVGEVVGDRDDDRIHAALRHRAQRDQRLQSRNAAADDHDANGVVSNGLRAHDETVASHTARAIRARPLARCGETLTPAPRRPSGVFQKPPVQCVAHQFCTRAAAQLLLHVRAVRLDRSNR